MSYADLGTSLCFVVNAVSSYNHAASRYLFLTQAVTLTVSGSVEMTDDEDVGKSQLHKLVNYVHLYNSFFIFNSFPMYCI